jgi:hypothetical protein
MAKKLKIWNGASWEDVTFAITPPNTSVTNSFSTNQVIDTSTSVAALRVTQRGTGEALRVEDDTNPDASPFVITATGDIGIGTSTPQQKLAVTGNIHMNGGTGTGISWASDQSSHYLKFDSGLNGIKLQGYAAILFETLGQNERMRIMSNGKVTIGTSSIFTTTTSTTAKLTVISDSNLNDTDTNSFISLRNKNFTNATTIVGGILSDTYRDIADPHYSAGMWFSREPYSGNASSGGIISFGTGANVSSLALPTERMRIDSVGNIGINNISAIGFNSSGGKVLNITGTTQNSGPATIMQIGSSASPGAGYAATEVFALSNIQNAVEITRVTGTGANGFRAYFKVIVTGHNGSVGNGINIKEFYWDGGTSAPVQISTYTSSFAPVISFDNAVNHRLVVLLASSNGSASFNGVMKIEWMLPVDFASSTYTLS